MQRSPFQRNICVLGLLLALISTVAGGCARPRASALTEDERRARVDEMYEEYRHDFPNIPEVDVAEAKELQARVDPVIVDVREPRERAVSTIPGSISREDFEKNLDAYRDRTIIAHCTIGYRSGKFVEELQAQGFTAYNLKGSILAWVFAGEPVVDEEGNETKRVHTYARRWALLPDGYEAVY